MKLRKTIITFTFFMCLFMMFMLSNNTYAYFEVPGSIKESQVKAPTLGFGSASLYTYGTLGANSNYKDKYRVYKYNNAISVCYKRYLNGGYTYNYYTGNVSYNTPSQTSVCFGLYNDQSLYTPSAFSELNFSINGVQSVIKHTTLSYISNSPLNTTVPNNTNISKNNLSYDLYSIQTRARSEVYVYIEYQWYTNSNNSCIVTKVEVYDNSSLDNNFYKYTLIGNNYCYNDIAYNDTYYYN